MSLTTFGTIETDFEKSKAWDCVKFKPTGSSITTAAGSANKDGNGGLSDSIICFWVASKTLSSSKSETSSSQTVSSFSNTRSNNPKTFSALCINKHALENFLAFTSQLLSGIALKHSSKILKCCAT